MVSELLPAASEKSEGTTITFLGKEIRVLSMSETLHRRPDIAIFSAGASASLEWAPLFAEQGTFVIDNSSAWRMDPEIPLVVPEVNPHDLSPEKKIIANPNCSTIQMVVALYPLHKAFRIKRVVVSTYQSVTGSGAKGKFQLEGERRGEVVKQFYPHPIDLNVIPEAGSFEGDEYTSEELKLELKNQRQATKTVLDQAADPGQAVKELAPLAQKMAEQQRQVVRQLPTTDERLRLLEKGLRPTNSPPVGKIISTNRNLMDW